MMAEGLLGGRYRIDAVAGHGGMATVFAAFDTTLERQVALKLPQPPPSAGTVHYERFRREARAQAKVVHPNVIAVFDVAEGADGRPFIVMEYVDGRPLSALIAAGPLPDERVAVLGAGIARGLAAAHGLGIVHRDVKPANVLVDGRDVARLGDFGLARALDDAGAALTMPGTLLGTAHYVAPEQARHGEASPRADLYALGAVLYHALAGRPPFAGGSALDVALRRFDQDPPDLRGLVPGIDGELERLVRELMARRPERRPADAATVAARLAAIADRLARARELGDAPTLAWAAPPQAPQPAPARRQRQAGPARAPRPAPRLPPLRLAPLRLPPLGWAPSRRAELALGIMLALVGCMALWTLANPFRAAKPYPAGTAARPVAASRPMRTVAPRPAAPALVTVPDVRGRLVLDAAKRLISARFHVTVVPVLSTAPTGTVVLEKPAPGSLRRPASDVRIWVVAGG